MKDNFKYWWGCGIPNSYITGGVEIGTAALENCLILSFKSDWINTLWPSSFTPWYITHPKCMYLCAKKYR